MHNTSNDKGLGHNGPHNTHNTGSLRQVMPEVAAWVDQLRDALGREWVDKAVRAGLRLQREHAARVAADGRAAADAWLARQNL